MAWKAYKKTDDHSYTLGAFPTYEVLENAPESVLEVFIHPKYDDQERLRALCLARGIKVSEGDKVFNRIARKGNVYVAAAFAKSQGGVSNKCHVVLDRPQDMGNLGTIIRAMVGMGFEDLVLIGGGADLFDPRTVRASMGALFSIRYQAFDSPEDYIQAFPDHDRLAFMLDDQAVSLDQAEANKPFALIFGNEASGLPESYKDLAQPVMIPQSEAVDSLNITVACAIALYKFRTI